MWWRFRMRRQGMSPGHVRLPWAAVILFLTGVVWQTAGLAESQPASRNGLASRYYLDDWQLVALSAAMVVFFAIGWSPLLKVVMYAGLKKAGWAIWAMILCDIVVGMFFFEPRYVGHSISQNYLSIIGWNFVRSSVPTAIIILWLIISWRRPQNVNNGAGWLLLRRWPQSSFCLAAVLVANYILASLIYANLAVLVHVD